jgi:hypothetical protein
MVGCRSGTRTQPGGGHSAEQVSGMAVLPNTPPGLGKWRDRARTANSAVFHNASLNAHIEWRFP